MLKQNSNQARRLCGLRAKLPPEKKEAVEREPEGRLFQEGKPTFYPSAILPRMCWVPSISTKKAGRHRVRIDDQFAAERKNYRDG